MTGAIAHDQAQRLRAAFDRVLGETGTAPEAATSARVALERLVEVLESSPAAVVFPSDTTVSTGQAADLLGVSRMTVVRLIDRGEIAAVGGGAHRRIAVSELARYRTASDTRRRVALDGLAGEIGDDTPPDQIITTR
ncbi:helix-turn-helix domain-containing protein [Rhodococcus sp. NPDC060090]|uniref:helix-turn-helix domain-containing protein n=1 Tax=Rhodococcus sp. NPDC060090 TaxID=3347056 RepID=UPI0036593899